MIRDALDAYLAGFERLFGAPGVARQARPAQPGRFCTQMNSALDKLPI